MTVSLYFVVLLRQYPLLAPTALVCLAVSRSQLILCLLQQKSIAPVWTTADFYLATVVADILARFNVSGWAAIRGFLVHM